MYTTKTWEFYFHPKSGKNIQIFLNDFWMHFVIVKTMRQTNQIWLENRHLRWCNASFYLEKVEDFQLQQPDR